ncbi:MAG: Maf family protein [Oscillospiraceae bacterium]|nr:Maf family protein [Oscillospiraceae bacterium]
MSAVVLASQSPRRKELLARMHVPFTVDVADVDEHCPGDAPTLVKTLARRKAEAVFARHPGETVIGADTVVLLDSILGKPRDEAEAFAMLKSLAGRWHQVYTGVCVIAPSGIAEGVEVTRVHFTEMTDAEVTRCVAEGDLLDKAGAYAIQGITGMYIDRVEGCPYNVMGLPLALTRRLLQL